MFVLQHISKTFIYGTSLHLLQHSELVACNCSYTNITCIDCGQITDGWTKQVFENWDILACNVSLPTIALQTVVLRPS